MQAQGRGGWLVVLALTWITGCGGGSEGAGWQAVVDTVADTVVVRTVAGSVWGDTARLVEELRIGAMEGEDAYVLGEPESLAVGNGRVYVLDAQVPAVRSYDAETGEYLGDVGREGHGPGEYPAPDGVAVLPDGRVLVRSPRSMKIHVYSPDGAFLESWPHPNDGGFHTYQTFYVDTAGTSWVVTLLDWSVPPWEWERALIGVDPRGRVTDTIPEPPLSYERADLTASRENSASRRPVPFTADRVWDFSPFDYMVGGITSRYAVYLFRPDGVLRIEREYEPVAVRPEEAEEQRARLVAGFVRQYGSWKWNGPPIPETKPPYRDVFVDREGRIWVVLSQPGRPVISREAAAATEARTGRWVLRYEEPPAFDVFDDDGRYLGPVAVPPTLQVEPHPLVRGDTVWAVARSGEGAPVVVRYRLVRDGTG